jgi:hypothetical protein
VDFFFLPTALLQFLTNECRKLVVTGRSNAQNVSITLQSKRIPWKESVLHHSPLMRTGILSILVFNLHRDEMKRKSFTWAGPKSRSCTVGGAKRGMARGQGYFHFQLIPFLSPALSIGHCGFAIEWAR